MILVQERVQASDITLTGKFSFLSNRNSYYEYETLNLDLEIKRKVEYGFSAVELKKILSEITVACSYLESLNTRHGDLRPEFIFRNEDIPSQPVYRLMDNVRDPSGKGAINCFKRGVDKFMSPLLYRAFCLNNTKVKHDRVLSDVFSLGLIILQAGIGAKVQTCYDRTVGRVRSTILDKCIVEFKEKYKTDQLLCDSVAQMVSISESSRPYFSTLKEKLAPNA